MPPRSSPSAASPTFRRPSWRTGDGDRDPVRRRRLGRSPPSAVPVHRRRRRRHHQHHFHESLSARRPRAFHSSAAGAQIWRRDDPAPLCRTGAPACGRAQVTASRAPEGLGRRSRPNRRVSAATRTWIRSLAVCAACVFSRPPARRDDGRLHRDVSRQSPVAVAGLSAGFRRGGMVGACADWFAVVALFRRPFGLPIPHTGIIPPTRSGSAAPRPFHHQQFPEPFGAGRKKFSTRLTPRSTPPIG